MEGDWGTERAEHEGRTTRPSLLRTPGSGSVPVGPLPCANRRLPRITRVRLLPKLRMTRTIVVTLSLLA